MPAKFLFYLSFSLLCIKALPQNGRYTIDGHVTNLDSGIIYLMDSKEAIVNQTAISKGQFRFTGRVASPQLCNVLIKGDDYVNSFYIENTLIRIDVDYQEHTFLVKGGKENALQEKISTVMKPFYEKRYELRKDFEEFRKAGDLDKYIIQENKWFDNEKQTHKAIYAFLNSGEKGDALLGLISVFRNADFYKKGLDYFKLLPPYVQGSDRGKAMKAALKSFAQKEALVNKGFPDIVLRKVDSTKVAFSRYKGKITLVDLWASWCTPCIAEFPLVKALYQKYHSPQFEILSISIDEKQDEWVKAVNQYQQPSVQYHLFDYKALLKQYGNGIPLKILIDNNGKVQLINPSFGDLDARLSQLLK